MYVCINKNIHLRACCFRYCRDEDSKTLEKLLHCDGIWLHAWRYSGTAKIPTEADPKKPDGLGRTGGGVTTRMVNWTFQTDVPDWAQNAAFNVDEFSTEISRLTT